MSSEWKAPIYVVGIGGVFVCLLLFLNAESDEIVTRVLAAVLGIIFLIGEIELLSRVYEFKQDSIRYRHRFRWREYTVPRSLTLSIIEGAIWFTDNQAGRNFLILTREFSRGGGLVDELFDFYNGHGRAVFIERESQVQV